MVKRNMKESMDNITNIKDSTAALSPEMQLAKERAKDKDEEFEKIAVNMNGELGAKKQPVPSKPKWSLDESLFDKPTLLREGAALEDNEIRTFANSAGAERRPLQSEDVQDLDTCSFETSADLLDYASDIANEELTSKEELQNYLDNQDYSDGSEIMYYVVFDGEVLIDDIDYFEVEMWNDVVDDFDESLGVSSSVESNARRDVTNYFMNLLNDQFLENPIQAQQLDSEINSYNADWCPQEFDSISQRKFNKVKSLIDQLSIALSDTYFDDNLMESLNESTWNDENGNPQPSTVKYKGFKIRPSGSAQHLNIYDSHNELVDSGYKTLAKAKKFCDENKDLAESLNESISPITKKEVTKFFTNKGFDVDAEDVQDYIDGVTEYINQWREEGDDYSIQDWYSDTRMNYPEDLEDLTRLDDDDDFDESLDEDYNNQELIKAVQSAYGFNKKEAKDYIKTIDDKTKEELIKGFKRDAEKGFLIDSLNEDIEVSDEDDVWDLIDSGYMDSEGIGDFLSEHDTAWDDICAFFDIEESDFDDQWDALIQIDAHDLADWISTHDQLWDDFCSYVYALRDRTLNGVDESLNEDTVKQNGKWVNKGDTGKTHGKFDTKKEADAQRKAMFANGFKG